MAAENPTNQSVQKRPTLEERFWANVEKQDEDGCWLWSAGKTSRGYGIFWFEGRVWRTHRIAYRLTFGDIPEGLCVLHRCDVPACVRPDHLWLGTHADNNADMVAKGRNRFPPIRPFGSQHVLSKLTEDQVKAIRETYRNGGIGARTLAARFGVDRSTIRNILKGVWWKHVN